MDSSDPIAALAKCKETSFVSHSMGSSWTIALQSCLEQLTPAEQKVVLSEKHSRPFTSRYIIDTLNPAITHYEQRWFQKLMKKIDPFLTHIQSFSHAINIYVQSNPEISGLIWGSLYLFITVGTGKYPSNSTETNCA
jgi:hypothetical protein